MKKEFRSGGIGALMDEYERAAAELDNLIAKISESNFNKIVDQNTNDEDCRSVQSIVSHIIYSGFGYADYIRNFYSNPIHSPAKRLISQNQFSEELNMMLVYTSETLEGKWEMSYDEITKIFFNSRLGIIYDMEQILEHAIVHILRHRRQIEKFILEGKIKLP